MGTEHVVVPWATTDLVEVSAVASRRRRDDLDDIVDELFPDVDGRPGPFDLLLVAAGVALSWWAVANGRTAMLILGLAVGALGVLLPVRTAVRAVGTRRRLSRIAAVGQVLDVAHPATAELARRYAELRSLAAMRSAAGGSAAPGATDAEEAVGAAHQAVVEVASVLRGRPPANAAEEEYVAVRTTAVRRLIASLRDAATPPDDAWVRARQEIDAANAAGSLQAMDAVTQQMQRGGGHGR